MEYTDELKLSCPFVPVFGTDPPARKSTVIDPGLKSPVGTMTAVPGGSPEPVISTISGVPASTEIPVTWPENPPKEKLAL